jgi:hypothetical protein
MIRTDCVFALSDYWIAFKQKSIFLFIVHFVYEQGPEPADVRLHAEFGASGNRVTSLTAQRGGCINT